MKMVINDPIPHLTASQGSNLRIPTRPYEAKLIGLPPILVLSAQEKPKRRHLSERPRSLYALQAPGSTYLAALLISVTLTFSVHYVSPFFAIGQMEYIRFSDSLSVGRPLGLLLGSMGAGVTSLLWLRYQPTGRWNSKFKLFLWLVGVTWLVAVALLAIHGSPLDISILGLPLLMVMIWAKPLPLRDVLRAIDLWALSVVGLAATYIGLQWAGLVVTSDPSLRRWQIVTPFGTVIERWTGPFGNVNFSGPLGAAILVYGITRTGMVRRFSVVGGLVVLVLSESRSAIAATVVGVAVFLVRRVMNGRHRRPLGAAGITALAALTLIGAFLLDTGLNGRTAIWAWSLEKWWEHPILGPHSLPSASTNGHNLLIDTAFQYGIVGLLPMIGALIVLTSMVVQKSRRGGTFELPMLAMVALNSNLDRLFYPPYFTLQAIPLLVIALGASSFRTIKN